MLNFDADDGHVRQRMAERNISEGDAEWVVAGGVYEIQRSGRKKIRPAQRGRPILCYYRSEWN